MYQLGQMLDLVMQNKNSRCDQNACMSIIECRGIPFTNLHRNTCIELNLVGSDSSYTSSSLLVCNDKQQTVIMKPEPGLPC